VLVSSYTNHIRQPSNQYKKFNYRIQIARPLCRQGFLAAVTEIIVTQGHR